uniref:Uncharacterized protein n=1 Tax=Knipowitschia caucasica TaxID=637954 RepID=A0AAV2KWZ7_KNICA
MAPTSDPQDALWGLRFSARSETRTRCASSPQHVVFSVCASVRGGGGEDPAAVTMSWPKCGPGATYGPPPCPSLALYVPVRPPTESQCGPTESQIGPLCPSAALYVPVWPPQSPNAALYVPVRPPQSPNAALYVPVRPPQSPCAAPSVKHSRSWRRTSRPTPNAEKGEVFLSAHRG